MRGNLARGLDLARMYVHIYYTIKTQRQTDVSEIIYGMETRQEDKSVCSATEAVTLSRNASSFRESTTKNERASRTRKDYVTSVLERVISPVIARRAGVV